MDVGIILPRVGTLYCCFRQLVLFWRDDFETAFAIVYSDFIYEIVDERPGDRELNFSPYVPHELEELVMEGFSKSQEAVARQWPWGNY